MSPLLTRETVSFALSLSSKSIFCGPSASLSSNLRAPVNSPRSMRIPIVWSSGSPLSRRFFMRSLRSEEHTLNSSHDQISYAVFCLKKKKTHPVYEWNYPRQLLHIRLLGEGEDRRTAEREIFSPEFLLRRPLLDASDTDDATPPVLLIDEIDRSDEEFEAFLLELLSDFQISIPELGTIKAKRPPFVVITSNRTREVHDALKRRCLYHWIDYPNLEKEAEIVRARAPEAADGLARQVAALVQGLRGMELYQVPGVAETLDWARSLAALGARSIDTSLVSATMGAALKYQEDLERVREQVPALVEKAQRA